MDRVIKFEYNDRPFEAYCPTAAIFDIYEKWGRTGSVAEITGFDAPTREGWDATCWLLAEFCRWGELRRRWLGEDPRAMLTVAELTLAPPTEAPRLRRIVGETLAEAFRRDIPDEEEDEVDLVLQELEGAQKKTPPAGSYGRSTSR